MKYLCGNMNIADAAQQVVTQTISNKKIHDFEDGLEYYSTLNSGCKCILTEDMNDFYFSEIDVLRPRDFLLKYLP